jgi:hypothetical protein
LYVLLRPPYWRIFPDRCIYPEGVLMHPPG